MAKYFSLFVKALLPRFLFIGHGVVCIWIAYLGASNKLWWGLSACLALIVVEGVFNAYVRKGKEFDCLFVKALLPRFLFVGHGLLCIWIAYLGASSKIWWGLTVILFVIIIDGLLIVHTGKDRGLSWFCPSAFFYGLVLLTTLFSLRQDMVDCIGKNIPDDKCGKLENNLPKDALTKLVLTNSVGMRASIIEQTGVLILIIGRWTLPKGSISRNQFSQILLIYVGTAADIVEFSELYGEEKIRESKDYLKIYRGVMVVWGWSILQFSLTIALPEDGLKQEEEETVEEDPASVKWRQTNRVAPMSYLHYKSMLTKGWDAEAQKPQPAEKYVVQWRGKYEVNKEAKTKPVQNEEEPANEEEETGCGIRRRDLKACIVKHLELITCLIPVLMQDGPFFIYRMVLIVEYSIITQMIILLTVKNALVIIVQIYRIMILYCYEPKEDEPDINDPSIRVRAALNATNGRTAKRSLRGARGSVAIQAISRMQWQYLHKDGDRPQATT